MASRVFIVIVVRTVFGITVPRVARDAIVSPICPWEQFAMFKADIVNVNRAQLVPGISNFFFNSFEIFDIETFCFSDAINAFEII